MKKLKKSGIGTRPFFLANPFTTHYKRLGLSSNDSFPVAERIAKKGSMFLVV